MSRERYAYAVAGHPISARSMLHRAWVIFLLLSMVGLLLLAKLDAPALQRARTALLGITEPVVGLIARPIATGREALVRLQEHNQTVEKNRILKAENDRLQHWQSVAMALKTENDALRALVHYQPDMATSYVTARVTSISPAIYGHHLTLNVGSEEGVKPLQPVMDEVGLMGRIQEAAPHSARVMLLSDVGSHVPVTTQISHERAIVMGTGDDLLRLSFVEGNPEAIALGETVVTSAVGEVIPAGIPVGQVFKKDEQGYLVKPMRALAQADYVRVVLVEPR